MCKKYDNKETQGEIMRQEIYMIYELKPHILIVVPCFSFEPKVTSTSSYQTASFLNYMQE